MDASGTRDRTRPGIAGAVGAAIPHDSSELHVSGEAIYTDDIPEPKGLLHLAVGMSAKPHARISKIDLSAVREAPGVIDVMTADDIPGENNCGPVIADDPVFAPGLVQYVGQSIFAVAAETVDQARKAAKLGLIEYEQLQPILDPRTAVEAGSFVLPSETIRRGDSGAAIENAAHRLKGSLSCGGQDQFYLEGQIAMAMPAEDGDMFVYSSTQHPGEVQHLVAAAIGKQWKDVVVECRRMGGAFGGKESQPALIACIAALMAQKTGKPCKLRLDRDDDMIMTGKRHDFEIDYEVGFADSGRIEGIESRTAAKQIRFRIRPFAALAGRKACSASSASLTTSQDISKKIRSTFAARISMASMSGTRRSTSKRSTTISFMKSSTSLRKARTTANAWRKSGSSTNNTNCSKEVSR
jgi:xanthine dehydrogenase large subunit